MNRGHANNHDQAGSYAMQSTPRTPCHLTSPNFGTPVRVSQARVKQEDGIATALLKHVVSHRRDGRRIETPERFAAQWACLSTAQARTNHSIRFYGGVDRGHATRVALLMSASAELAAYHGGLPADFSATRVLLSDLDTPESPLVLPSPGRVYASPHNASENSPGGSATPTPVARRLFYGPDGQ